MRRRLDEIPSPGRKVAARAARLDVEQAGQVIQLDPDALEAWLFGPDAE